MSFTHRRLPHLHVIGQPLFVTFRLHGSLPRGHEFPRESLTSGEAFVRMDRLLEKHDAGPLHLRMPAIAQLVVDAIQHGVPSNYLLHAWVVMPNHVHLLITPQTEVPHLLHKLKGSTAREANKLLIRTGTPFWQAESYDHVVRSAEEYRRIESYIIRNPVRAGLAQSVEDYPWSSAAIKP